MDILYIVILGIIASLLYVVLKDLNPSIAFLLILITGIIIFLMIISHISSIFQLMLTLGQKATIDGMYLETILKIIGIAYIAEFGASITKDAGLGSVAGSCRSDLKLFTINVIRVKSRWITYQERSFDIV